jgi:hypothetical protein
MSDTDRDLILEKFSDRQLLKPTSVGKRCSYFLNGDCISIVCRIRSKNLWLYVHTNIVNNRCSGEVIKKDASHGSAKER